MPKLTLRERRPGDLAVEWRWSHAEADPEWKLWDGPYFHSQRRVEPLTLEEFMERATLTPPSPHRQIIALDGVCIGLVTRSEEAPAGGGWWELGTVIYDPAHWGGNERMVRAAGRVGYRECARIPEARAWNGQRWDSVKLALLRSDAP